MARPDDLAQVIQMGYEFYQCTQEASWGFDFKTHKVESVIRTLTDQDGGFLLVADAPGKGLVGMLGMIEYETWFHTAKQLLELWWWVDPAWRGEGVAGALCKQAEDIGLKAGFDTIIMANLDYVSEEPAKMYLKNGYVPYEAHYAKQLL